ncbi:hypothetical protein LC087_19225 (plasmid) [Bacillus carboniphilus]|uniref:Bacteriophage lambda Replication protein O N-terminal domain-containing protein n=1 Tax=Bacillus carboniphilus TaxID=86663 RepID=A0ABY9JYR9_9BACI|nr:hypothetical protein [Bacillus carboniphilus]WLR44500.1 hypothetical protein LC087_19225 [Bacillus carboniphilus]
MFKGFQAPNQHTQVPNEFFDEILLTKGITIAEVKILGFMVRYTFGWQRAGNSLSMTFTEIMNATKLGREAVNNGLKKCLEKEYLQRKEINGDLLYRLKIKDFEDYPWELSFDWQKVHPEKETISKTKKSRKSSDTNVSEEQFDNRTKTSSEIEPIEVRKSNRSKFDYRTDQEAESIEPVEDKSSLNKGLNKSLNKVLNKSIKDSIKTIDLPVSLKIVLERNIDRLIDDEIELVRIKEHYDANKERCTEHVYADMLEYCLEKTKGKIKSIKARLNTGLKNRLELNSSNQSSNNPVRSEKLPKWMENGQENTKTPVEDKNTTDANFEAEKKALEERIKNYYAKKDNSNLVDHG